MMSLLKIAAVLFGLALAEPVEPVKADRIYCLCKDDSDGSCAEVSFSTADFATCKAASEDQSLSDCKDDPNPEAGGDCK